jgi:hypothetical protein
VCVCVCMCVCVYVCVLVCEGVIDISAFSAKNHEMSQNNESIVLMTSICLLWCIWRQNISSLGKWKIPFPGRSLQKFSTLPKRKTISIHVEYFINGSEVGFLVSDIEQNLVLFAYQPEDLESFGGQRLLIRGDCNVGSNINTMFRIRVSNEDTALNKQPDQRQVTVLPTLDGSIFSILPLAEKPYRR